MNIETTPHVARYPRLDTLGSPEDLKLLGPEDLSAVCDDVRRFLLDSVQSTGGHLGSNIGVVELATALHYVFDFRRDRLVWDVSHQCYPHKVLTGRRDRFPTLRQTGGLCGFTHPEESEYDLFHTGHAGTSVSLGLGMAIGLSREEEPPQVVSVIGDASLGAGVAFEGLNHAGSTGHKLLVVLNDNEWSISKTVGAMARYLARIRSAKIVQRAQQEIQSLISAIPVIGPRVDRTLEEIGEVIRHSIVPGHVFEELGVTYVGPIDGHDVKLLVENLKRVSRLDGVVLLHILTEKGKGHPKAPTHEERVHAVKGNSKPLTSALTLHADGEPSLIAVPAVSLEPVEPVPARAPAAPKGPSYTQAFADALGRLAEGDMRVHAITAAMPSGTGLVEFASRFPARFHDTGITEQHAIAMAAGMAKVGLRPVAAIYSTFLQRGYDQVFQEVALQKLPVMFCLDRAGLVGQDGPTHNGVFDIAFLRTLPHMVLGAPRDASDMERMLRMGLAVDGPVALRYPRDTCPGNEAIHPGERREMRPGTAEVLREGERLVLWAYGALVKQALEAADRLARQGARVGVVDARFAKPLDEELLAQHALRYRHIVTVEEHQRAGGFGSAVLEAHSRLPATDSRVKVLGVPDRFLDHATTREEQLSEAGIDAEGIERSVRSLLITTRV
jgi:1-deoxy-D-xylulose-5-phosphate synthase